MANIGRAVATFASNSRTREPSDQNVETEANVAIDIMAIDKVMMRAADTRITRHPSLRTIRAMPPLHLSTLMHKTTSRNLMAQLHLVYPLNYPRKGLALTIRITTPIPTPNKARILDMPHLMADNNLTNHLPLHRTEPRRLQPTHSQILRMRRRPTLRPLNLATLLTLATNHLVIVATLVPPKVMAKPRPLDMASPSACSEAKEAPRAPAIGCVLAAVTTTSHGEPSANSAM